MPRDVKSHDTRLQPEGLDAVALPFVIFTAIWGSTWIVIRGQLGVVPPQWSVAYRFAIAAARALTRPDTRACSTISVTTTAISGCRQCRSWSRKPGVTRTPL